MSKLKKKIFIYVFICELCLNFITTAYAGKVYNAVLSNNWDALINAVNDDPTSVNDMDRNAFTAVMKAVEINNFPMFLFLTANDADINAKDDNGRTVLMQIIYNYQYNEYDKASLVNYLIKIGANINIRDYDGATALIHAAICGNMSVIKLLLEDWGANVNDHDYYGWTPLMICIARNYGFIVEYLIKNSNININAKNYSGNNALMLAFKYKKIDVIEIFMGKKVNLKTRNHEGLNVLDIARKNDMMNFFEMLLKNKKPQIDKPIHKIKKHKKVRKKTNADKDDKLNKK